MEIIGTVSKQYPQILIIEFILDKTKLLNSFKKDDKIKIFKRTKTRFLKVVKYLFR
ncbi:hypothetical protein [Candidatus Karelsulcia muelleri]